MRVLLTNDDGFDSSGLGVLHNIIESFASEVWIFAPERDCSGSGRSVGLRRPIKVRERGKNQYSVDGTPSECVIVALNGAMNCKPDLILSGINHGANVGNDVMYSGTVAAAMEGAVRNIASIAFSQSYKDKSKPISWLNSENFIIEIITNLLAHPSWKKDSVMNVNFPNENSRGIKFVHQGSYPVSSRIKCIKGECDSYVIDSIHSERVGDGSVRALIDNYIAITPLHADLTNYDVLHSFT